MIVSNDDIQLLIDSPAKYDGTKENEKLEKVKHKKINQNYNVSKELFIDYLLEVVDESVDIIDEFIANNSVDLIVNGRTINKLSQIIGYMKFEGFGCVILAPILILGSSVGICYGIIDKEYQRDNLIGFITLLICCSGFFIFALIGFINGINYVLKYYQIKFDLLYKRVDEIHEKPIKVRLIRDQRIKYSHYMTMRFLKLYYPNHTKILVPFDGYFSFNPNINLDTIYKRCLELGVSHITYLAKSKIAISGGEKYVKLLEKACSNNE